jgi:DnaA family protein
MIKASQLPLPLELADHAVFESFLPAGNETLVAILDELASGRPGPGCWLWGPPATGKTHLLQAVCERAGDRSMFVPIAGLADGGPQVLDGLESRELVCLDDFDAVARDGRWERALFALCNQLADANRSLVVATTRPPRECRIGLADLSSRLSRLPVFHVRALRDDERVLALQLRARHRGLDLPIDTARYLLSRIRRDMASLYGLLDRLDREALRAQRRLTIPFVRQVLRDL